jgi:hypothetical protein
MVLFLFLLFIIQQPYEEGRIDSILQIKKLRIRQFKLLAHFWSLLLNLDPEFRPHPYPRLLSQAAGQKQPESHTTRSKNLLNHQTDAHLMMP